MRILKIILWIVLVILGIYIILCATGPKEMNTTKTTTINASPDVIYSQVADYNMWAAWSPWNAMDPGMKSEISGTPGEVGHKNKWDGEEAGKGEQGLIVVRPNEYAKSYLLFQEGSDSSYADFNLEPIGDSTRVTWSMNGPMPFLMRGAYTLMMKKMLDRQFEDGLANLKSVAESKPKTPKANYEIVETPETWYVGVMHPGVTPEKINEQMYSDAYTAIDKHLEASKTAAIDHISIAHNFQQETMMMDLEIAKTTAAQIPASGNITSGSIPAGKTAKFVYTGPYEKLGDAWNEFMGSLMKDHQPRWDGYEIYVNNPGTEPDPNKLVTYLMQPIQ